MILWLNLVFVKQVLLIWKKLETAAKIKEDPEILCNLGMAYLNNGDLDDAVYYIERAYELDPQDEITIACLRELDKYR